MKWMAPTLREKTLPNFGLHSCHEDNPITISTTEMNIDQINGHPGNDQYGPMLFTERHATQHIQLTPFGLRGRQLSNKQPK